MVYNSMAKLLECYNS